MAKFAVIRANQDTQDLNLSSIRIKKPYTVNDNIHIFDISRDDAALTIQTSPCVIPYSHYIFDNKSFQFDVHSYDLHLKGILGSITSYILARVRKYNANILNERLFLDYVKEVRQEPKHEYRIRLRNVNVNNISVFDNQNNIVDITTLQTFDKVVCLFQLHKLIVQKETYFFQASVVQIKKINTPLLVIRECLIQSIDESSDDSISGHTEVSVYEKMKKVGVPVEAIDHKIRMDNKPHLSELLQQIKRVPKPETSHVEAKSTPKIEKALPAFSPPSLSDILKARTKLKPVSP